MYLSGVTSTLFFEIQRYILFLFLLLLLLLAGLRPLALRDVCFCVTPENYFTFFLPSTAAEEEEAAPQEAAPHVAIATAEFYSCSEPLLLR